MSKGKGYKYYLVRSLIGGKYINFKCRSKYEMEALYEAHLQDEGVKSTAMVKGRSLRGELLYEEVIEMKMKKVAS